MTPGTGRKVAGPCRCWVKSGHDTLKPRCPLFPRKQTFGGHSLMSALGQKRTHALQQSTPAIMCAPTHDEISDRILCCPSDCGFDHDQASTPIEYACRFAEERERKLEMMQDVDHYDVCGRTKCKRKALRIGDAVEPICKLNIG
jgi:hypothetical protein